MHHDGNILATNIKYTNIQLFVCREVEFKVLHVLRCFVEDESSSELSRSEPEGVAGLAIQLKLCMYPACRQATNTSPTINTHQNYMQCRKFFIRIS
jgi:hypothetical protein